MPDTRKGYGGDNQGGDPAASASKAPGRMHNLRATTATDPYDLTTGHASPPSVGQQVAPKGKSVTEGPYTNLGSGDESRRGGSGH